MTFNLLSGTKSVKGLISDNTSNPFKDFESTKCVCTVKYDDPLIISLKSVIDKHIEDCKLSDDDISEVV